MMHVHVGVAYKFVHQFSVFVSTPCGGIGYKQGHRPKGQQCDKGGFSQRQFAGALLTQVVCVLLLCAAQGWQLYW
jgi:hypothetical protein